MLYRPTIGFKDIVKSFMRWADGGATDCPKLKWRRAMPAHGAPTVPAGPDPSGLTIPA